jgi:hypothetical protein
VTGRLVGGARRSVLWMFRNRHTDQITVAQFPNVALTVFLVSEVVDRVGSTGRGFHQTIAWIGAAALAWWAVDEVVRGVNPWRRLLGLAGCALVVTDVMGLAR